MFCFSLDTAHGEAGIPGVVREGNQRAGKLRSPGRAAPMSGSVFLGCFVFQNADSTSDFSSVSRRRCLDEPQSNAVESGVAADAAHMHSRTIGVMLCSFCLALHLQNTMLLHGGS